ncbi:biopolymer transporter ExbD [Flavobacterium sp. ZT3R18]|uniref:ExbD/TolR family protein n=1 Tax=Flavobacterium sp. ZT3R18 TaxID=2594429 RepID=UPI001179AB4F|nr:biopolymer transporter ExbD [Flavobacterium sp. ZT3R18]TRX30604.1 biopolymer transporter ExbD [Flavobacterium sp. ZT3R18]
MGKIKMTKKSTSTDMTAMCDVAFLLLTFFILTATAKVPEVLPVDTPQSTVQTKLPATDLSMLTIGKANGKSVVFFDLKGKEIRQRTLELMAEKYNVTFTPKQSEEFGLMESFGVPIQSLSQILDMKAADRSKAGQTGIPKDSLDNQLKDWILYARTANIEVNDKELQFAIKGDAKEQYPAIKQVMDILQDQKVNSFNLVTGLRGKNF